jgi:polysaccharide export outer membrane protein
MFPLKMPLFLVTLSCFAQQVSTQSPVGPKTGTIALPLVVTSTATSAPEPVLPRQIRSTYLLGPDDQITVQVLDAEEVSGKPTRIDISGYIRLPLAGRIKAAGLSVEQLENAITERLRKYIKEPEVSVSVVEFRSQPVSIIGSVRNPGVHQLQGRKSLVECLSLAGGTSEESGYSVKITRKIEWGPIPLPSAVTDPTGKFSIAQVNLEDILTARNPAENITVFPEDIISVPRANTVYVIGTVARAGGYILHEKETLSVLQALSLAGGIGPSAAPQNARILRPVAGNGNRIEIPVNLRTVMTGQSGDLALQPEDILFVPSSAPKKAMARAAEVAIQLTTGLVLYRR